MYYNTGDLSEALGMQARELTYLIEAGALRGKSYHSDGTGHRRLYTLKDACEVGAAFILYKAGFKPQLIGRIIEVASQEMAKSAKGWGATSGQAREALGEQPVTRGPSSDNGVRPKAGLRSPIREG